MAKVRVMQEGWGVFENLPATAARFTEQTGIEVEVTLTVIPEMWELMERSFSGEDPPFDLVGVDDLLLVQAARAGHVEPLDDLIAADGYPLDDFTPQALAAVSDRGKIWGLPYCDVSNVLIYRADLFETLRHRRAADAQRPVSDRRRGAGRGPRRRHRGLLRDHDPRRAELRPQLLDGRLDLGAVLRRPLVRRRRPPDARHPGAVRGDRRLRRPAPPRRPARVGADGLHGLRRLLRLGPRGDDDRAGERGVADLRARRRRRRGHEDGADAGGAARDPSRRALLPAVRDPVALDRRSTRRGSSPSSSARPSRCWPTRRRAASSRSRATR